MQVHKITNLYGEHCNKKEELSEPTLKASGKEKELLYVEVDGSMLYTRDEGWKEVKVGRAFTSSDCISPDGKPGCIRHSQYYAGIMDSKTFTQKMDALLDAYSFKKEQLVFITDGGIWIKNWIEDSFSQSVAILDYYHAVEHLSKFGEESFENAEERQLWATGQKELLLQSKTNEVIENIKSISTNNKEKQALLQYYQSNEKRMDYKYYKTIGAGIIGSGAIESAHRTLVQKTA